MSPDARSAFVYLKLARLPLFLAMCLGVIALFARVPGGIWVLVPSVVLFCLLFSRREHSVTEWVLVYSLALLSGFRMASVALYQGTLLDALTPLVMLAVAIAVISSPLGLRKALSASVLVGFLLVVCLGVWEALAGQSLAITRYGNSGMSPLVLQDRFVVSALFPNYNDYSVVLFFVSSFFLLDLFDSRSSLRFKSLCVVLLVLLIAHGLYMGSRGFQLAIGVALFMIVLAKSGGIWRLLFPTTVSLSAVIFVLIFSAEFHQYFFDVSTAIRLRTIAVFGEVLVDNPSALLFGFPSLSVYTKEMAIYCDLCLVDPHNLILEVLALHGVFGVVFLFVLLISALRFVFLDNNSKGGVLARYFSLLVVTSPFWGVISSSSLKYFYIYFFAIFFIGLVAIGRHNAQGAAAEPRYHGVVSTE